MIDECPPYIALSYVWGTDEPSHEIRLNNRVFLVRDNLWHALSRLADQPSWDLENKQVQYFWIDALCINQKDLLERGHQVDLMGLIFSRAYMAIAWLGLAEYESDLAMEIPGPNLLTLDEEDRAVFHQNYSRYDMERCIEDLLSRDYFSRMWVVQEVLLARDIMILCGSECRSWDELSTYVAKRNYPINYPLKPSIPNAAQALITARNYLRSKLYPRLSLDSFLMRFGAGKCSDARDRVYGLLGLMRATCQHSTTLQADYTISTVQVYCRAMEFMQTEKILLPGDPSYCQEVSTVLANALDLPQSIHQSINITSTIAFHFRYEIQISGGCGFSELLHRCILPLEVICNIELTSPFDYDAKYEEVIRKLDFFPVDDNPKMWSEFEETLRYLLAIWSSYISLDPKMEQIPLNLPLDKQRHGKIWVTYQRLLHNFQLLVGRGLVLKKLQ